MDHEDDYDGDVVAIIQLNGGDKLEASLTMLFNDAHISVTVIAPPNSAQQSIEKHLVDLINQLFVDEDADFNNFSDQILDVMQPAGEAEFQRVAPKAAPGSPTNTTLHTLLYPMTHYFAFRRDAPGGQPVITPMSPEEIEERYGPLPPIDDPGSNSKSMLQFLLYEHEHLPRFTTKEIDVVQDISFGGSVTRVRINSLDSDSDSDSDSNHAAEDLFCKATNASGGINASPRLRRELECLLTLHERNYQTSSSSPISYRVRTPHLVGLVTHPENGDIVGFVRQWIQGELLSDVLRVGTSPRLNRYLWADQLRHSIQALHAVGLVWGDAKPSNVIVEGADLEAFEQDSGPNGDLWLIDFGGGWTDGWVDRENEGTREGDKQAVRRIEDALRL